MGLQQSNTWDEVSATHVDVNHTTMADLRKDLIAEDADKLSLNATSWKLFEVAQKLNDSCVFYMLRTLAEAWGPLCPGMLGGGK